MKRSKYSQEFREEAIKMVVEEGHTAASVERNLGMSSGLLGRWIRQHTDSGVNGNQKDLLAENKALKKENKRLKQEREILKKAATFFARETN
jgi:transposase